MFRRTLVAVMAAALTTALISNPFESTQTAQAEPRPISRPADNSPEISQALQPRPAQVSRTAERKPVAQPAPKATKSPPPEPARRAVAVSSGWSAGAWHRFPSWVEQIARCIAGHESWSAGLWSAQNRVSTASGAFQFIDSSWRAYSRSAGLGGYSKAKYAPARVQAAVFAHVVTEYGRYPWRGTGCPGT